MHGWETHICSRHPWPMMDIRVGFAYMLFVQWVLCDEAELVEVPVMLASHTLSIRRLSGKEKRDICTSLVGGGDHPTDDGACWSQWAYVGPCKVPLVLYFCRVAGAVCRKQCYVCRLLKPWKLTCLPICHWVPSSCALHLTSWIISFQSAFLRNSRDA